jgi:hypothetical protein
MKSIITTYPDFQALPRGIKKMLLASEDFFFGEVKASHPSPKRPAGGLPTGTKPEFQFPMPFPAIHSI